MPQVGSNPVIEGPNGGVGLIARWSGPYDPPLGYSPSRQTWQPASKCGELAAGRYWLGFETEAPPKAAELSRRFPLVGQPVKLGEEVWTVPIARELPQSLGVAADGTIAKLFDDPRYADYFDRAAEAFAALGALGGTVVYSAEQQFRFAAFALGFNYRVNADVLTLMLMSGPLYVLYAICVVLAYMMEKKDREAYPEYYAQIEKDEKEPKA